MSKITYRESNLMAYAISAYVAKEYGLKASKAKEPWDRTINLAVARAAAHDARQFLAQGKTEIT